MDDEPRSMDVKLIQKLVRMMARAELSELEIDDAESGLKLRLKRGVDAQSGAQPAIWPMPMGYPASGLAAGPASGGATAATPGGGIDVPGAGELPPGAEEILSPMVGTFYRSPSPDTAAFVEVGTRVDDESVICIIEAMKVMNEIKAEVTGEILATLVENGEPVEFGQPLFLVKG